jgi:hypothetical protein
VNIRKIFKDSVQNGADRPLFVERGHNKTQKMVFHSREEGTIEGIPRSAKALLNFETEPSEQLIASYGGSKLP